MPTVFFGLQRFFLRVDDVMFRAIDVRIYHEFGTNFIIRNFQDRSATFEELGAVCLLSFSL